MNVLICVMLLFTVSCGSSQKEYDRGYKRPAPAEFGVIKGTVDEFCTPCHQSSPFIQSGNAFKNSSAQARIRNGNMPPANSAQGKAISDEDRARLLGF